VRCQNAALRKRPRLAVQRRSSSVGSRWRVTDSQLPTRLPKSAVVRRPVNQARRSRGRVRPIGARGDFLVDRQLRFRSCRLRNPSGKRISGTAAIRANQPTTGTSSRLNGCIRTSRTGIADPEPPLTALAEDFRSRRWALLIVRDTRPTGSAPAEGRGGLPRRQQCQNRSLGHSPTQRRSVAARAASSDGLSLDSRLADASVRTGAKLPFW
jgi:hypothetical protein